MNEPSRTQCERRMGKFGRIVREVSCVDGIDTTMPATSACDEVNWYAYHDIRTLCYLLHAIVSICYPDILSDPGVLGTSNLFPCACWPILDAILRPISPLTSSILVLVATGFFDPRGSVGFDAVQTDTFLIFHILALYILDLGFQVNVLQLWADMACCVIANFNS